jgi:NAD(P)-dependent dehydrogenase (short-subunit alcohol dehydrogenase family)
MTVGVGGTHGDVTAVDLDAWDRDFRTNASGSSASIHIESEPTNLQVTSMVMMSRHAIPEMRKVGRGAIVNMCAIFQLLTTKY